MKLYVYIRHKYVLPDSIQIALRRTYLYIKSGTSKFLQCPTIAVVDLAIFVLDGPRVQVFCVTNVYFCVCC